MLVWKEASFLENLQIFYCALTMSEEEKLLTVAMATFRDNKQTLYGIFQDVLTILPIHRKTASPSLNKDITAFLHNRNITVRSEKLMQMLSVFK